MRDGFCAGGDDNPFVGKQRNPLGDEMSFWRKLFGKQNFSRQSVVSRASSQGAASLSASPRRTWGAPTNVCLACQRQFDALLAICPTCGDSKTMLADHPTWFAILQAHVTAVQANDTAVRLFREERLDEAITEVQGGLAANSQYATGYSNLGFLYLRKGQLDQAVECLLHALEVDPHHKDAPDHLVDVLSALIDELVQIGFSDGFLSLQPGGTFDDRNRHIRTREIGALLAKIGESGVFTVNGKALASIQLLAIIVHNVQKRMHYHNHSFNLTYAWEGIRGSC